MNSCRRQRRLQLINRTDTGDSQIALRTCGGAQSNLFAVVIFVKCELTLRTQAASMYTNLVPLYTTRGCVSSGRQRSCESLRFTRTKIRDRKWRVRSESVLQFLTKFWRFFSMTSWIYYVDFILWEDSSWKHIFANNFNFSISQTIDNFLFISFNPIQ